MKLIQYTLFRPRFAVFACSLPLITTAAYGQALFDFDNNNPLDSVGIDGQITALDPSTGIDVTITTVEITGADGSLASAGEGHVTNSTGADALGINSVGVDFDALGFPSIANNSRDFNPGELWTFTFDVDVTLGRLDFAGWGAPSSVFTISFDDGTPDIVLSGGVQGDTFDLSGTPVAAGVAVTMGLTNTEGDVEVRAPFFEVSAVPPPLDGDNLIWAGADGDAWNTVDANFSGDDTIFEMNDNVEIQTAGAINVDAGGITVGLLSDTTAAGVVTLQTGDLTINTFDKSGAASLVIASPVTVESGPGLSNLSGGALQVSDGATFGASILNLSGDSLLQVDTGGTLNVSQVAALDTGGGTIQVEDEVSIPGLNVITPPDVDASLLEETPDIPFTKTGAGNLTITGGIGSLNVARAALNILEGSITVNTTEPLNIGAANLDGDLILDGTARIDFHGTTTSGAGSIIAQSGPATIDSRFNFLDGTPVFVNNDILLNSDLILEAPAGGQNAMTINGIISGVGNLRKDGNGIIFLTETNTYTGTTTIDSGILSLGNGPGSTSGTLGTGDVEIDSTSSVGILEFSRDDAIVIDNLISGVGNVRQDGGPDSSTTLTALNTYGGVTEIRGGTLVATSMANFLAASSIGTAANVLVDEDVEAASSLVISDGGTLSYTGPAVSTNREFTLGNGGGTLSSDGTGPLDFVPADPADSSFPILGEGEGEETRVLTLAGSFLGTNIIALPIPDGINAMHAITKAGPTTWSLTGANTYTGPTSVEAGTLSLGSDFLADASDISIAAGATLDLPHGLIDTVGSLTVDGVNLAIGVYGAMGSGAAFEIPEITGTGQLNVTALAGSDFDLWGADFGLVGGPDDDDDNDGLTNQQEYAFGLIPNSGASVNPFSEDLDQATGVFVYTRRNNTIFDTGLVYTYGSSTDLQGDPQFAPFTPDSEVSDGGDPVETVTVTLPAGLLGNPTLFIQISAE